MFNNSKNFSIRYEDREICILHRPNAVYWLMNFYLEHNVIMMMTMKTIRQINSHQFIEVCHWKEIFRLDPMSKSFCSVLASVAPVDMPKVTKRHGKNLDFLYFIDIRFSSGIDRLIGKKAYKSYFPLHEVKSRRYFRLNWLSSIDFSHSKTKFMMLMILNSMIAK